LYNELTGLTLYFYRDNKRVLPGYVGEYNINKTMILMLNIIVALNATHDSFFSIQTCKLFRGMTELVSGVIDDSTLTYNLMTLVKSYNLSLILHLRYITKSNMHDEDLWTIEILDITVFIVYL